MQNLGIEENNIAAVYQKLEGRCLETMQGILGGFPEGANATGWCRQGGSRERFYETYGAVVTPPLQQFAVEMADWLRDNTTEPGVRATLTEQLRQYVLMTGLNPVVANWDGFLQARQNLVQTREALDDADLERRGNDMARTHNAFGAGGAGSLPALAASPTLGVFMGSFTQLAFVNQAKGIAEDNYNRMVQKYGALNQQSEKLESRAAYELIEALGQTPFQFIDTVATACVGSNCSRAAAEAAAQRVMAAIRGRLAQLNQLFTDIPRALQQLAAEAEAARLAREQAAIEADRRRACRKARTWGLGICLTASALSVLRLDPNSHNVDGALWIIAAVISGGYVVNYGISTTFKPSTMGVIGRLVAHFVLLWAGATVVHNAGLGIRLPSAFPVAARTSSYTRPPAQPVRARQPNAQPLGSLADSIQNMQAQAALERALALIRVVTNSAWRAAEPAIDKEQWDDAERVLINSIRNPDTLLSDDRRAIEEMSRNHAQGWGKTVAVACQNATAQLGQREAEAARVLQGDIVPVLTALTNAAWAAAKPDIAQRNWSQAERRLDGAIQSGALPHELELKRRALMNNPAVGWNKLVEKARADAHATLKQIYDGNKL
ncbi:MAG: hypothetical protein NT154_21985 [Verrucomicrobia bacterium]|nr:hypothetical protein [Verrucomicrobiota bacterium]